LPLDAHEIGIRIDLDLDLDLDGRPPRPLLPSAPSIDRENQLRAITQMPFVLHNLPGISR
jgi:hypothetical protein